MNLPEGLKLYLVTLEFVNNEQRTRFKKGFFARDGEDLKKVIDTYLMDYYGLKNSSETDNRVSYYRNDDFSAYLINWEEITSLEQFLDSSTNGV